MLTAEKYMGRNEALLLMQSGYPYSPSLLASNSMPPVFHRKTF